uniref:hypothetical protein n=1 Tax=Shigella flexneri TaxID=623 RepID=UPI0033BB93E4
GYPQTNRKIDTGKTLTRWPVFVDHFTAANNQSIAIEQSAIFVFVSGCTLTGDGFAPIFPDICYHLTHYKPAAADIPV